MDNGSNIYQVGSKHTPHNWKCHSCGDGRPVSTTGMGLEERKAEGTWNIRHGNDPLSAAGEQIKSGMEMAL